MAPALRFTSWETLTGCENLLILATRPGDESIRFGGLIAQSCRRGRPPFVMVMTDGSRTGASLSPDRLAAAHERETRAAVAKLGLPANRLLMAGLFEGSVPEAGDRFEAAVRGVSLVSWARDCNVVCVSGVIEESADHRATHRIAAVTAERCGLGLLLAGHDGRRLDVSDDLALKYAAIAMHRSLDRTADATAVECFA